MMIISGSWNPIFLYVLILIVVPLIHIGFAVVIRILSEAAINMAEAEETQKLGCLKTDPH